MNKKLAAFAAAVVTFSSVVLPAGAAHAASAKTLPAGISMYIFDQAGRGVYESDASGALTKTNIVLGDNFTDVQSGAFNYGTHTLWTVDNTSLHFGEINLTTGVLNDLGTVSYGSDSLMSAFGLDFVDATHAKLLIADMSVGLDGTWGIFDMDLTTGNLTNPLWLNVDPGLSIYGLGIDFAHGGAMYVDTSDNSINLVNNDGSLGSNLADPLSLDPYRDYLWDGKFDSNGTFWTMSANCCSLEEDGYVYTYATGETDWAYQGTTSPAASGPVAVGESTPKQLPNTGTDPSGLAFLWVTALLLLTMGTTGVVVARRRQA